MHDPVVGSTDILSTLAEDELGDVMQAGGGDETVADNGPSSSTTERGNDGASTTTGGDTDGGTSTRGEKRKAVKQGSSTGDRGFRVNDGKQIKSKD